jgi:membrane-bound metal-dependent hydrolase YbcI (DUF457 family)
MRFYTHIPAGLLLYTILIWVFNQPYTLASVLVVVLFSVLPDLIDKVTGEHRGWGHSVIWLIPIAVLFVVKIQLGLACFSAFSMHILLDSVTKTGVPFLYPFSKTRMVMPKKEKSRIQTGSKQETALCIVIVLLLIPLTYCVLFGVPGDLFSAAAGANKTNKTGNNSTLLKNFGNSSGSGSYGGSSGSGSSKHSDSSSPLSSLTKDLKSSGSSGSSGTSKNSGSTNSTDSSDSLLDWLDQDLSGNSGSSNTQTNTNQTSDSNTDNSNSSSSNSDGYVSDASPITNYSAAAGDDDEQDSSSNSFYEDLRNKFADLAEGVQLEDNASTSDQSMFDFDFTDNPDSSDSDEDFSVTDQLGLMLASAAALVGGGLVGKP